MGKHIDLEKMNYNVAAYDEETLSRIGAWDFTATIDGTEWVLTRDGEELGRYDAGEALNAACDLVRAETGTSCVVPTITSAGSLGEEIRFSRRQ